jgi:hypothetical protein
LTNAVTADEAHKAYIAIVKSTLGKIQKKHSGEDPTTILNACMQALGRILVGLGDLEPNEAFMVLGLAAAIPSAVVLKNAGPAEVAPYVKGMAELFAYTLLDRLPSAIDQVTQQDKLRQRQHNNTVVLS